jgi:hypothetical protein
MPDEQPLVADTNTILKWTRYRTAQGAKARWAAEEKEAKLDLLAELGYDPEDEKPAPVTVEGEDGQPLFEVKVGERRGLDAKYLKANHPDVYAEAEKVSHPVSVREL